MRICGFSKYENKGPKSYRNRTQNVLDLWILYLYSSNSSLRLETLITQVNVDLWIFEIQYIKTIKLKETGRRTKGNLWIFLC